MSKDIYKYNFFHKNTRSQSKVISAENYTYWYITKIIDRYAKKNMSVLDIGCGSGTVSTYLSTKCNSVIGIDISSIAIKACKETALKLGIKNAKFSQMKFPEEVPDKKFDLIVCFEVIEHLQDDELAIKQIYDHLKKNGIAIISTPSSNAPLNKLGLVKEFDKRVGHLRRYTMEELELLAMRYNLKVIKKEYKEGIVRNFLFTNNIAGKFIRFIKFGLVPLMIKIDEMTVSFFNESDLFIIVKK